MAPIFGEGSKKPSFMSRVRGTRSSNHTSPTNSASRTPISPHWLTPEQTRSLSRFPGPPTPPLPAFLPSRPIPSTPLAGPTLLRSADPRRSRYHPRDVLENLPRDIAPNLSPRGLPATRATPSAAGLRMPSFGGSESCGESSWETVEGASTRQLTVDESQWSTIPDEPESSAAGARRQYRQAGSSLADNSRSGFTETMTRPGTIPRPGARLGNYRETSSLEQPESSGSRSYTHPNALRSDHSNPFARPMPHEFEGTLEEWERRGMSSSVARLADQRSIFQTEGGSSEYTPSMTNSNATVSYLDSATRLLPMAREYAESELYDWSRDDLTPSEATLTQGAGHSLRNPRRHLVYNDLVGSDPHPFHREPSMRSGRRVAQGSPTLASQTRRRDREGRRNNQRIAPRSEGERGKVPADLIDALRRHPADNRGSDVFEDIPLEEMGGDQTGDSGAVTALPEVPELAAPRRPSRWQHWLNEVSLCAQIRHVLSITIAIMVIAVLVWVFTSFLPSMRHH